MTSPDDSRPPPGTPHRSNRLNMAIAQPNAREAGTGAAVMCLHANASSSAQ